MLTFVVSRRIFLVVCGRVFRNVLIPFNLIRLKFKLMEKITSMRMLFDYLSKIKPLRNQIRHNICCPSDEPLHLICFKQWTADMVLQIICSARNLKLRCCGNTHNTRLDVLRDSKVLVLQEVNEPMLNMAVSKAATFLGAYDVNLVDHVLWEHDYNGCIFSSMADAIFVSTSTHWCLQRFADQSSVPVMCMRSRTHATIQSLATIMAIFEEFGSMCCLNLAYVGPPHPILNSYLLLCPMLGANIKFKCCCNKSPVSPFLYKAGEEMTEETKTLCKQCTSQESALEQAMVIISGPSPSNKEKIPEFVLSAESISKQTTCPWIYFHTCPRGKEVDDELFYHDNSRTFVAFDNLQYIAAALLASAVKRYLF